VDLGLTSDQEAIREIFASFFADRAGPDQARAAQPLGFDPEGWARLGETGAPGMGVPVDAGGGGASLADLVVVAEEAGANVSPLPLVDHTVTARLLAGLDAVGDDVVSGAAVAGLAVRPATGGLARSVPAGAVAEVLVALEDNRLVVVRGAAPGEAQPNHADMPIAHRSVQDGEVLAEGPEAVAAHARAVDEWRALTGSLLVGATRRAIGMAVDYVSERHQFGRPVGSFQAVQHGLADLPGLCDGARLLVAKTAWAGDRPGEGVADMGDNEVTDFAALAAMALVFAGEAALRATDRSLHYHGGYGFAEEYDIQLYYRRVRGWAQVLDDPARECRRLAGLLLNDREVA